ncbi:hypothetical protein M0805_001039 [Coniferiporia weirii]|nr:hypothetical protein M0805_001039 [Coniferiporia weirii]
MSTILPYTFNRSSMLRHTFGGLRSLFLKLLSNPQFAELLRFILLGTVVEVSKLAGQKAINFIKYFFIVKASFKRDDFAFEWVQRYLEDLRVWDQSRVFRVSTCSPHLKRRTHSAFMEGQGQKHIEDGRPTPVYQPAPNEPVLFRWRNHWITVDVDLTAESEESKQVLTLSVWSRNRKILDDFVQEARAHSFSSPIPPRKIVEVPDTTGSVITARFMKGDISYEWMHMFMRSRNAFESMTDVQVTTKPSELPTPSGRGPRAVVAFKPAPDATQRLRWGEHWLQFDVDPNGYYSHESNSYCGCIVVTVHNTNRSVLQDLVQAARGEYLKSTTSKVTVHLSNSNGIWMTTVTKNRRSLSTLILPEGVKEALLADARDFLDSEEWYTWAGVPHRRGYLLYGEPGTGKSTTIHALAGELGLEIYYIQLASQGMTDSSLAQLISDAPSRCIILLEDLDCAFPSREDDDDNDEQNVDTLSKALDHWGDKPRSEVTLSGLLNVLDSVSSEEGRITFATTNHIERLDPALIRAGRMDVKVEYKLATRLQISQTFLRFYERGFRAPVRNVQLLTPPGSAGVSEGGSDNPELADEDIFALSEKFADIVPEGTFAIAQVQGLLLTKKYDPCGAVADAGKWVEEQLDEKRRIEELREKRKRGPERRKGTGAGTPASVAVAGASSPGISGLTV